MNGRGERRRLRFDSNGFHGLGPATATALPNWSLGRFRLGRLPPTLGLGCSRLEVASPGTGSCVHRATGRRAAGEIWSPVVPNLVSSGIYKQKMVEAPGIEPVAPPRRKPMRVAALPTITAKSKRKHHRTFSSRLVTSRASAHCQRQTDGKSLLASEAGSDALGCTPALRHQRRVGAAL